MTFEKAKEIVAKRDGYRDFNQIPFHLYEEYLERACTEFQKVHVNPEEKAKYIEKQLESEEFYDLMQAYRIASIGDQEHVSECFESVKQFIKNTL